MQYRANQKITDGNYDKSLAVRCINGTFVGKKTDGVIAWRGIPFVGKQPVGENRWKAPVEFAPDDGVYEAYYRGKSPCQHKDFSDVEESLMNQGEDCLWLNVWKADDNSTEKKPVMVWIHGGAFEFGAAAFSLFDCDDFLRENPDVIVVTVAYRLGIFGYFHLSHLADGGDFPDSQNLGPLDQLMGLKWVHENIAAFGGDPDNVTIYGESAGAGSVSLLPLLKGSHAYFKRVIAQSGSPALTRSPEEAMACTNIMLDVLGCKTVADLVKLDARTLADESEAVRLRICPERDGKHLPVDPLEAYAEGAAKDLDLMFGCNRREFDWFAAAMGEEETAARPSAACSTSSGLMRRSSGLRRARPKPAAEPMPITSQRQTDTERSWRSYSATRIRTRPWVRSTTKPSQRPCGGCGCSSQRPAILPFLRTCLRTKRPRSVSSMTRRTGRCWSWTRRTSIPNRNPD